jgi:hypothetical protein
MALRIKMIFSGTRQKADCVIIKRKKEDTSGSPLKREKLCP